jgi:HlyD family secretion protein
MIIKSLLLGGEEMKVKLIKSIVAWLIVAGVAVGGFYGYKALFPTKTAVAATSYITATARKMDMQVNIQGTGAAYSAKTKDVVSNNAGTLENLSVKVGETVKAGQKLFTSASDDVSDAVTTAENSVDDVNISLSSAKSSLTSKKNQLSSAKSDLTAKKKELTAAKKELSDAQKKLTDAKNTSASEEEIAELSRKVGEAEANLEKAETSVEQAATSVEQATSSVEQAESSVKQANLKVSDAKDKLSKAEEQVDKMAVTAPIGGLITAINNSDGDNIDKSKAVLTIVDMSAIKVKVAVDELDIEKVKEGQIAEIKFDAIKDKTYEGEVESIAQVGNNSNNVTTFDVVVAIKDPTGIKIGMNANVNILVDSKNDALVIPAEALVERNGQKFVMAESTGASTNAQQRNTQNSSTAANEQGTGNGTGTSSNQQTKTNQGAANSQDNWTGQRRAAAGSTVQGAVPVGRLVAIKTGIENENYIEVTEGLTEGQRILITLPQTTTTTNQNMRNAMGGFGASMTGGRPQGGFPRD